MRKFAKIALGGLMLAGATAATMAAVSTPAEARVSIGFGFGVPGYYGPAYGPAPCYRYYYYGCPYYGPAYYDPYYYDGYYGPNVYIGGGWGGGWGHGWHGGGWEHGGGWHGGFHGGGGWHGGHH